MTNNNNIQSVIIRIAFAKGSDEIHVGLTKNGNKTFVGEIVYSDNLLVSQYNKLFEVDGESIVGSVGTICVADDEEANALIEQIESIQAARPVNARGNKYPFLFLRVMTEGDIIFNKGVGGAPNRLSFLDVELIEVEGDAPDEVLGLDKPQLTNRVSNYGTVKYRRNRIPHNRQQSSPSARRSTPTSGIPGVSREYPSVQTNVVQEAANLANEVSVAAVANSASVGAANSEVAPSFNTKTVEVEGNIPISPQDIDSQDSPQDKLNAIAVAMKAAGLSPLEIALALKEQVGV
ncbi:MAG: hypothetical protein AAGE84_14030 [Cyanobacteria bacterium P01_G01_bin.39]